MNKVIAILIICISGLILSIWHLINYPNSSEYKKTQENALNYCKTFCLEHDAVAYQYNGHNGCTCMWVLP